MGRIDVAYGATSSEALLQSETTGRAISLRLLTEKMPHFEGITPAELATAAKDFATYVSDVPDCIQTIRRVLTKAAFGQISLLIHWAKELGQQVRAKKISREDACMVLEGYFLSAVSMQLKGLCVHGVALGTNRLGPQFIRQYLQEDFAEVMREETSAYVEAVEYLIFSSLDPIMLTGVKDGMDEREFPKHVDELLLRADLVSAALQVGGPQGWPRRFAFSVTSVCNSGHLRAGIVPAFRSKGRQTCGYSSEWLSRRARQGASPTAFPGVGPLGVGR